MNPISMSLSSSTPKYRQIVASIEESISKGLLKKGDKLPSLNEIRNKYKLSRETVITAFKELKSRGIIHSVVGKGYYVASENVAISKKIFLLFDEFNSFKEDIYNSFLANLPANTQVDIFFHHFNPKVFRNLILDSLGNYNFYVIMPANVKNPLAVIKNLPKDIVYILDQVPEELSGYASIYQNFHDDIFNGLSEGLSKIKKYSELIFLYDKETQPTGILRGFESFCHLNKLKNKVIKTLDGLTPKEGELYIILDDKNLIRIIKKIRNEQFVLSKNIGVISYNETMLKEIVEKGITTISTDFNLMGSTLAKIVINNEQVKIQNPSRLILRKSI
jgi:DNA-binding transcriptional regulator YhcF (GntR family)